MCHLPHRRPDAARHPHASRCSGIVRFAYDKKLRAAMTRAIAANEHEHRRAGAALLAAGRSLRRLRRDSRCAKSKLKPQLVACMDRRSITRRRPTKYLGSADALHLANWRSRSDRRTPATSPWSATSALRIMAAGGQGAPLVPMLDFCIFRARDEEPRAAQPRRHRQCHRAACRRAAPTM